MYIAIAVTRAALGIIEIKAILLQFFRTLYNKLPALRHRKNLLKPAIDLNTFEKFALPQSFLKAPVWYIRILVFLQTACQN